MIRTGREISALVADDETCEILFDLVDREVHHLNRVAADRVHLRMKLETRNAVAEIDQRRTRICLDDAGAFLDRSSRTITPGRSGIGLYSPLTRS